MIICGDCREFPYQENSVHFWLTDPPYWPWEITSGGHKRERIGALRGCIPYDPGLGYRLTCHIQDVADRVLPALCPGGFAAVFSQPRLAHRTAAGLEDAGFEIRDMIAWVSPANKKFKAFSLDYYIGLQQMADADKESLRASIGSRKSPQLRPQFQSIILAQRPKIGTHIQNWLAYETGLMDATATLDGKSPANVMQVAEDRRASYNTHPTPKPVALLQHLIHLYTAPGQTVLDTHLGSGSTAVAAHRAGRDFIGIDLEPEYVAIAERRLQAELAAPPLPLGRAE